MIQGTASDPSDDAGFSLIEGLVAMAVLAVAAAGLLQATARRLDLAAGTEARVAAGLAADNALTAARLGIDEPPAVFLRRRVAVRTAAAVSADRAIDGVVVTAVAGGVAARLHGFADHPATPAMRGVPAATRPTGDERPMPVDDRAAGGGTTTAGGTSAAGTGPDGGR
ncbi:MAG: prepilin-type N-terminal cleavage/methylation domain-containing protein [Sphingomonadaceae bacterium]|nr:prepilin-type N-terminal cleavage/methylation domain-containing protein [Sphingomonadaceae bacterium]